MTTGDAWHVDEDATVEVVKPWAWFDKDDIIKIPMSWVDWLADKGTTYSSHTIVVGTGLVCPSSSHASGIITIEIKKDPAGAALVNGQKYTVTCRLVGADGQSQDRTLHLKIAVT